MNESNELVEGSSRSSAMRAADVANGEGAPRAARCALIAVDETPEAVDIARAALRVLGPDVRYVLVNVATREPLTWGSDPMMWGAMAPTMVALAPAVEGDAAGVARTGPQDDPVQRATEGAETTALSVAQSAGIPNAEPVGATGSTAEAICALADEHGADVIVVGDRNGGWLQRLLAGSVTNDVLRAAGRPVLVVP
ncbi:MAG: universal stress protein [Actinomycetota bacterium]|nr:universal stress protein [Actinomycetota bacterium]